MRQFIRVEVMDQEDFRRALKVIRYAFSSPDEWEGPMPEVEITISSLGDLGELFAGDLAAHRS